MKVAIIQARLGSTRLPGKVFLKLANKPLIWHVVNRLTYSKSIDKIVLATTTNPSDDDLYNWAKNEKICTYRGSENNVLERFYHAAKENNAKIIIRVTADDPFKDPQIIDKVIEKLEMENLDFAYNNNPPTYPEGLDTEVFTFEALQKAFYSSNDDFEKEHVTQFFYRNLKLFKQSNYSYNEDLSYLRWTIDTEIDLQMATQVYDNLYNEARIFLMNDILEFLKSNPKIGLMNKDVIRSSMYKNK